MLTDAILSEAAAEAERFLLSIVPEDGEPHVFSKRFERKMQKLIRRTDHPVRYQVMRIAAAVVLAIVTLFGAVMAVSPEARAAVAGWVKGTFCEFFEYSIKDSNAGSNMSDDSDNLPSKSIKYDYQLSVAPTGYQELTVLCDQYGKSYMYVNDYGHILQFTYSYNSGDSVFVKAENYDHHSAFIHECLVDIYISPNENETSIIIWQDSEMGVLFQISAITDQTGLIELAESVIKMSK